MGKRNEAAEKLVAAEECGACGCATHEALNARAIPDLAGKHVWTEILDIIVALQTASDILLTLCYLHRQAGKFFRVARRLLCCSRR